MCGSCGFRLDSKAAPSLPPSRLPLVFDFKNDKKKLPNYQNLEANFQGKAATTLLSFLAKVLQ